MALTYQNHAGSPVQDCYQIAHNGPIKIFYLDQDLDFIRNANPNVVFNTVSDLVDDATEELRLMNLDSTKLNEIEGDIWSKSCPTNRVHRRVFNSVMDQISARESKIYFPRYGNIMLLPRKLPGQTDRLYICGQSGAGKSTFCAKYALEYQKEFPGNRIFLFSLKDRDPAFDNTIPDIIRIPLDRKFANTITNNPDILEDYEDSLLVFDDFESVLDSCIRKAIFGLKDLALKVGRCRNISVCSIQHRALGGAKTLADLTEANIIVCFPKTSLNECKSLLLRYCNFTKHELERVFDQNMRKERWMALIRSDKIIITEHFIKIIN